MSSEVYQHLCHVDIRDDSGLFSLQNIGSLSNLVPLPLSKAYLNSLLSVIVAFLRNATDKKDTISAEPKRVTEIPKRNPSEETRCVFRVIATGLPRDHRRPTSAASTCPLAAFLRWLRGSHQRFAPSEMAGGQIMIPLANSQKIRGHGRTPRSYGV